MAKKAAPKKAAAKKAPVKKVAAKKAAPAKKVAAKKAAPAKKAAAPAAKKATGPITGKLSKSQMLNDIAESTALNRKQVASVLDELESIISRSVNKKGSGEFTLPGLLKIMTVKKPARKARKGVNPFTGEEIMIKAKPASTAVRVRPLKKLKEFAAG